MAPDDFIRSLQQIRAEVQALYAMQCMARVEIEQCAQAVFEFIDRQVDAAIRASISNLTQTAREMNHEIQDLNRQRGRYFGTILDRNAFGLLVANRKDTAIIIPLTDLVNLDEKPSVGDQIGVTYEGGKCQIRLRA